MKNQGYSIAIPRLMRFRLDSIHEGLGPNVTMKIIIEQLLKQGIELWHKDKMLPEIERGLGRSAQTVTLSAGLSRDLEIYNRNKRYGTMSTFMVALMDKAIDRGWRWADDFFEETEFTDPVLRRQWQRSVDEAVRESEAEPLPESIPEDNWVNDMKFDQPKRRPVSLAEVKPRAMTDEEKVERMRRDEEIAEAVTDED